MDEAKKKELEEIKKQIDPEVLKRVAESMGGPSTAQGGESGSAPPPIPSSGGAQLSDLKRRIQRREKEISTEQDTAPKKIQSGFVIYDPSHFRAKQIGGFFNRMGFSNIALTSDPSLFVRSVISYLNNQHVEKTGIAVFAEDYGAFYALIMSEALKDLREKLPQLIELPVFLVVETTKAPPPPSGISEEAMLSLNGNPEANARKVKKFMEMDA